MREAVVAGIAEAIRRAASGVAPAEVAVGRGAAEDRSCGTGAAG